MAKQHEILAAEKTVVSAWKELLADTQKKFKKPDMFHGHSRSLSMIADSPANKALEDSERSEQPVITTVYSTLDWMLKIFHRAESLQYQKNVTNRKAVGTVMWEGAPFLTDVPVDELMGLEKRLVELRALFQDAPTLDASKHWVPAPHIGDHVWELKHPIDKVKTDKVLTPHTLYEATEHQPAQVHIEHRDLPVGKYTTVLRSGEITAVQKSDLLKRMDDLLVQVKAARMRANETEVADAGTFAQDLVDFLLEPLAN